MLLNFLLKQRRLSKEPWKNHQVKYGFLSGKLIRFSRSIQDMSFGPSKFSAPEREYTLEIGGPGKVLK
jgi:hypothetical protein